MLEAIGLSCVDDLFRDILPQHTPRSFDLPAGLSEYEVIRKLNRLALKNSIELIPS